MPDYQKIFLVAFAFILPAQSLFAAPFCVQTQAMPPECVYSDPAECRKRALELKGFCVANPAELVIRSGETGQYCLVLSSRDAQCLYADRTSCENDAGPANGVCIEKSATSVTEDPYQLDINRKY